MEEVAVGLVILVGVLLLPVGIYALMKWFEFVTCLLEKWFGPAIDLDDL